jgi:chemotaxis signal transduction protein
MTTTLAFEHRVADLRRAFDRTFASEATSAAEDAEDLLAIRVAGDRYALRLGEMSGLATGRKVTRVPSRRPGVLGIASVRGSLLSVHSLAAMLGYGLDSSPCAWLAISVGEQPVGLAFEQLDGFLRLRRSEVHPADGLDVKLHVRDVARAPDGTRPVVESTRRRCRPDQRGGNPWPHGRSVGRLRLDSASPWRSCSSWVPSRTGAPIS